MKAQKVILQQPHHTLTGWLAGLFIRLAVYLPGFLIMAVLRWIAWPLLRLLAWLAAQLVQHGIRGEHRAKWAPFWLAAAAAVSLPVPGATWWWASLTVTLPFLPAQIRGRAWLSARERDLAARAVATLTLTLAAHAWYDVPAVAAAAAEVAVCATAAVPWIRGRIRRPEVRPLILDRWDDEVASQEPQLAGQWEEFDEPAGMGVLKLDEALASEAAKLDEVAEWALDQPRGTVTISADPRLSVRCVRVAFTQPGHGGRLQFWDGPTLGRDGRFTFGYAKGALPIQGRLWTPSGSLHGAIIGASGSGKGGAQRLVLAEAAICPDILTLGVCGKGGKGIGYLRAGFFYLATDRDEWGDLIAGVHREMQRREDDDTNQDDSFVVRPGVPRILLIGDEFKKINQYCGATTTRHLEEIGARGRSLGIGLIPAAQKGDGPSYGSTDLRNNVLGNGWLWAGVADDAQAKATMVQNFDFDPSTLPDEPGWAGVMGRALGTQPVLPSRTLWIPNDLDLAKAIDEGLTEAEAAPFGTVEQWLTSRTVHPELLPEAQAALGLAGEPDSLGDVVADNIAHLPAPARAEAPGWLRIRDVLAAAPDGLQRSEIARRADLNPRTVSEHLAARLGAEVVKDESKNPALWRLAA